MGRAPFALTACLAAFGVGAGSASMSGCVGGCYEAACGGGGLVIVVEATSGALPEGDLLVTVEHDGETVLGWRCNEADIPQGEDSAPCERVPEVPIFEPTHVGPGWLFLQTPIPDASPDDPTSRVTVRIEQADGTTFAQEIAIDVDYYRINGPGCEPLCAEGSGTIEWDV